MNTRTWIILGIVIVLIAAFAFMRPHAPSPASSLTTVSYSCNQGKAITAAYHEGEAAPAPTPGEPPVPTGSVDLTLSDGRTMTLARTLSADGTRYANADESFVFWSKGNGALVLENNQEKSYIGCIVVAPAPGGYDPPQVYSNSEEGFSLRLPEGYTADEAYRYQAMGPGKDIFGTKFTIPQAKAAGTNLSSDSYLSVEEIPSVQNCTASLFLENRAAQTITEGGTEYSVASFTGAAAGNRYEETVYALPGTNPCIAVRYFVHYGVIENYPEGSVREFDRAALLAEFDAIRKTLTIVQ